MNEIKVYDPIRNGFIYAQKFDPYDSLSLVNTLQWLKIHGVDNFVAADSTGNVCLSIFIDGKWEKVNPGLVIAMDERGNWSVMSSDVLDRDWKERVDE